MSGSASGSATHPPIFHRRESTKRDFTTMEERERSSSPDSLFVGQDDHYHNERISQRQRLALPTRREHFPGDGLDFRRPVMSEQVQEQGAAAAQIHIIDLTEEDDRRQAGHQPNPAPAQRPPRFGRNIIDLDTGDEEEDHRRRSPAARQPPQPNYMTLFPASTRQTSTGHPRFSVLRRPQRTSNMEGTAQVDQHTQRYPVAHRGTNTTRAQRSVTPYPNENNEPIDLTGDDDDDIVHVATRPRPGGVNMGRPETTAGSGTRSLVDRIGDIRGMVHDGRLMNRVHTMLESIGVQDGRGNGHRHRQTPNDGHVRFGEARQGGMGAYAFNIGPFNLEAVAFDLGLEGGNRPARPPTPKYEPPTAAEPGFTRSPGEDDVVVCPNCGDELAMGEDDLKQEIWVIKKCGHAYCGVCTQNRTKAAASRSKGKGKAREVIPFNKCVVKDCDSSASAKSMVHVYLGS